MTHGHQEPTYVIDVQRTWGRELKYLQPHYGTILHHFTSVRRAVILRTIVQQPAQTLMGQDGLHNDAQKC